ncbi:variant erythrocyte surface antigen-1 family protein [Babesia caballi]|uniref:Variant erythrocyte surface antigen-1 family protein n=1 Tax=Babesia caballi TaxID=5871 RepID=A0AAV4LZF3_BABCB|nr:variant erythrocyte surface antigen-1 family protein [Babesia caballi]
MRGNGSVKGADLDKLREGLQKAKDLIEKDSNSAMAYSRSPIAKLAIGLSEFIGYTNHGILSESSQAGQITGAGIAPSNMATHRLCDATIAFTEGVLESISKDSSIKSNGDNKQKVSTVISKLSECYGKGPKGLKEFDKEVGKLEHVKGTGGNQQHFNAIIGKVKEGIKNNTQGANSGGSDIHAKVSEYLKQVFEAGNGKADVTSQLSTLVQQAKQTYDASNLTTQIRSVKDALNTTEATKGFARDALYYGKENFIKQLEKGNYKSYFNPNSKWKGTFANKHNDAARIFLSCIPFVYYGLSYFCWRCREQGEWAGQKINEGAVGVPKELRHLLYAMGYIESDRLAGHYGRTVMTTLSTCLMELKTSTPSAKTYVEFIKELRPADPLGTNPSHPLSVLFLGASCYFQSKRSPTAKPPSTIRTMLCWLTGLSVTPQFVDLLEHLRTLVKDDFKVAVSGCPKTNETLTPDDLMGHLITSCLSSCWVLGTIQGSGGLEKPLLHEVFCSTEVSYPSSTLGAFNALANYAYALQFQLTFLLQQCRYDYSAGCGWKECKFGQGVTPHTNTHLCPKGRNQNHSDGKHSDCNHSDCDGSSPLQAFLTDKLKGFSRGYPSDPSSHLASCSKNSMCHVPMGFHQHLSSSTLTGNDIREPLRFFCGESRDPLRQLGEKLGCLTKRTPRTLGDVFGFTWHLTGQMFNKAEIQKQLRTQLQKSAAPPQFMSKFLTSTLSLSGSTLLAKSLDNLSDHITFWDTPDSYGLASLLATNLFSLKRHCHTEEEGDYGTKVTHNSQCSSLGHPDSATDLWSICNPVRLGIHEKCAQGSCGGYLSPLTYSSGAAFTPNHASVYLSWILYLTDDLDVWLKAFLDAFNDHRCVDCKHGCTHAASNLASQCGCPNIVECADVRPLLYANGFNYGDAFSLKGGFRGTTQTKQTCRQFRKQLSAVLKQDETTPLFKLVTTIDNFLYAIRWEFFSKLSGFWTIYVCLILYTFFFLLDTLHLRSHLKLTSLHSVPPLALLTSGTPLPMTKLTYITQ